MTAGFIHEDQLLRCQTLDRLLVECAFFLDRRRILLSGAKGLFFRVSSNRSNARLIVIRLTRTRVLLANCSQRSANDASGCSVCSRTISAPCGATLLGFPPPCGLGATLPVCRYRCNSSCTKLRLTPKSRAKTRCEPRPAS